MKMMRKTLLMTGLIAAWAGSSIAGDLDSPGAPAPTMRTLQEIYEKLDEVAAAVGALAANPVTLASLTADLAEPRVLSVDPSVIVPAVTPQDIRIGGTNMSDLTQLFIGGVRMPIVTRHGTTQIVTRVSSAQGLLPGWHDIEVANLWLRSTTQDGLATYESQKDLYAWRVLSNYNASLVSHWKLGEQTGTRSDSKGLNHLASVNGVGALYDGAWGYVADFDRAGSQSLQLDDGSQIGLDIAGDLTINLWIKPSAYDGQTLVSKWHHGNANQYVLSYQTDSSGTLALGTDDSCSGYTYAFGTVAYGGPLSGGPWYMVSVTRSGSTARFYVNGVQVGANQTVQTAANCGAIFALGTEAGRNVSYYDGLMANASIWSRALSASDLQNLYAYAMDLLGE